MGRWRVGVRDGQGRASVAVRDDNSAEAWKVGTGQSGHTRQPVDIIIRPFLHDLVYFCLFWAEYAMV